MQPNIFSKLKILLNSRRIFKNWYIYPKIYFKLTNAKSVIFETVTGMKICIRTDSTDLMALTNIWMVGEYNIEDYAIDNNDTVIDIKLDDGGNIKSIILNDNGELNGDIFVDCTGFKRKLIS